MNERTAHLDLLADCILGKMNTLCGEAVKKAFAQDVFAACRIKPNAVAGDGAERYEWAKDLYAQGLLDDVMDHVAKRWASFRETERRLHSAASLVFDDEGEFEP